MGEKDEIIKLLKNLIYLSAVTATELLQITENTSAILRKGEVPARCLKAHQEIRKEIIKLVEEALPEEAVCLKNHLGLH